MNPVQENDTVYVAYLCSRIPNNECDLCSHYIPEYILQTQPIRHPLAFGYHGHDKCPSCRRSVTRVFVSSNMPLPKRVPSELPFRFPDDVICGHFEFAKTRDWTREQRFEFVMNTKPSQMREDLDWEERNRKMREYLEATSSGNSRKISEVSYEEPNKIPVEKGKEIKRKIKFS